MANALTRGLRGLSLLAAFALAPAMSPSWAQGTLPMTLPIPDTTAVTAAPVPPQPIPAPPATATAPTGVTPLPMAPVAGTPTGLPAAPAPATTLPMATGVGVQGPLPAEPATTPMPPARLLMFGSQMFSGRFGSIAYSGFNPGYQIAVGDMIVLRLWGAVTFDATETVDAQGNVFVQNVGPIHVQGVRNADLTSQVAAQVKRVYRANVGVYATLVTAQPVKVYVTGFVRAPGLYPGLSSDSVLYYLDRAGGIDQDRGSYLQVEVLRGNQTRLKVNLYKFLLTGQIDDMQFHDGDTIVVGPRQNTIPVYGFVNNPYQFELADRTIKATDLMALAKPQPSATHLSVVRVVGMERRSFYYPIDQLADVTLQAGDQVVVTADQYPTSIAVHITGAQMGDHMFVLPMGSRIKDLLPRLTPSPTADIDGLQLFRPAVAARQKESLDNTLNALQTAALTARNSTLTEAQARQTESTMIMNFIDRARSIVPRGQVVMTSRAQMEGTLLQDGDVINVPEKTNLVEVSGEVQLPNTLVWEPGREADDYIALVGGFTQRADRSRVLVMRRSGAIAPHGAVPEPGDEIMVLPVIETKYIEVASGITSILYQLAVSAKVLTGF